MNILRAATLTALLMASVCPSFAQEVSNLRGQRFGEILLGKSAAGGATEYDVYSTIGLNDCPEELWSKLDVEKIKKDTESTEVKLNGPRYWTVDGLSNASQLSKVKTDMGGIKTRHLGTDKVREDKPYVPHKLSRVMTWVFKAGQPVYQLIGPDGYVYFMQSYSCQKKKQDAESLAKLENDLTLNKGWQFRVVTLKNDYEVSDDEGEAWVVQDDFDNTYQLSNAKKSDEL